MIVTSKNLGLFDNIVAAVGRPDQVELGVVTGVEKKEEEGEIESVAHLKRLTPTNGQIGNFLLYSSSKTLADPTLEICERCFLFSCVLVLIQPMTALNADSQGSNRTKQDIALTNPNRVI